MENLLLSFEIIFPIFAIMAIGYFIGQKHWISEKTSNEMNRMVFKLFLPLQLFGNVYSSRLSTGFNGKLMGFAAVSVVVLFLLSMAVAVLTDRDNRKRGVMAQGMFRANFVIFGLPVVSALFGSEAEATAALLIAVVVPMFNVFAVVALTVFGDATFHPGKILKGIVTNPLIIACLAGLLLNFSGVKLPEPVFKVAKDLGKVATPLAFILLGASFQFNLIRSYRKHLLVTLGMRLVICPLIVIAAGVLMGFRNTDLAVLLTMSGAPIAVSSYTMAQQMGGDDKLASQLVVFSSAFSILSMFLWIFVLKQLAFL